MLHAHQRIAIPPEDRELLEIYHARHRYGDLRKPSNHRRLAQRLAQERRFRLGADAITDVVLAAPPTLGSAFGAVRQAYARKFDKPRWGDKRPVFLLEYDVILRLFPDAQLIHIVRDGRAVASLKRMPWWKTGAIGGMARWVESIKAGERLRRRLRADQFCEIRYEDLVETRVRSRSSCAPSSVRTSTRRCCPRRPWRRSRCLAVNETSARHASRSTHAQSSRGGRN